LTGYPHAWGGDGRCAWCGVHFLDATGQCWSGGGLPDAEGACDVSPWAEFLPAVGDELAREDGPAADPACSAAAGLTDVNPFHDFSVRGAR
jgi:hypothetical protein